MISHCSVTASVTANVIMGVDASIDNFKFLSYWCHWESYNGHIVGLGSPDQLMLSWTFSLVSGLPGCQVDTREWRWWMMMILTLKFVNILKCENSVASLHTLLRTLGGTSGGSARKPGRHWARSFLWHSRSGENQLVPTMHWARLSVCPSKVCTIY